jgi:glutamine---fructose-6-phosphate transaminase (isomerizing)
LISLDPTQGYLHDILEQPTALQATYEGLESSFDLGDLPARVARGEFQRILLTGMGSSYHVQFPLFYALSARGLPAQLIETSELIYHAPALLAPRTLVVTVSQSGRSAEIVRLLDRGTGKDTTVLGVTNTAGSPLDQRSAYRVVTRAGEESNVSCKTYVTALMALDWASAALTGAPLEPVRAASRQAAAAAQAYLGGWREHVAALEGQLKGIQHLFLTGRGSSLAAAGTGGLITKESSHTHSEGMSSAALRHGPMEMLGADCFVLVFGGEAATRPLNANLYQELRELSLPAGYVDFEAAEGPFRLPAAPESQRSILEILPVELITIALAHLRNHVAGTFTRGSKVTTTE